VDARTSVCADAHAQGGAPAERIGPFLGEETEEPRSAERAGADNTATVASEFYTTHGWRSATRTAGGRRTRKMHSSAVSRPSLGVRTGARVLQPLTPTPTFLLLHGVTRRLQRINATPLLTEQISPPCTACEDGSNADAGIIGHHAVNLTTISTSALVIFKSGFRTVAYQLNKSEQAGFFLVSSALHAVRPDSASIYNNERELHTSGSPANFEREHKGDAILQYQCPTISALPL
jgi:hypothetical protein